MSSMDVFCERCGTRQPADPPRSGSAFSRMLDTVGLTVPPSPQHEPYLRLCFSCRGYSCPNCWNDALGVCQTCEPLPEHVAVEPVAAASVYEPVFEYAPEPEGELALEPFVVAEAEPEPESFVLADIEPEPEPEPEPVVAAEAEPEPEPVVAADIVAAEAEPEQVVGAEAEAERIAAEAEPEQVAAEPEPESAIPEQPPSPLLPANPFGPARPLPPPVRPRIEFDVPPPPPAFMIDRERRAPLRPPPVPRPAMDATATAPQARECSQCQLPLSARANFCRRCGSSQAASA